MSWLKVVLTCIVLVSTAVFGQRNPYSRIEAESFDINTGTKIVDSPTASNAKYVGYVQPGDVIGFKRLNFSAETIAVQMRVSCLHDTDPGRVIYIRLDKADAPPLVSYIVESTGSWERRITSTVFIPFPKQPRGVHDIYFTFEYKDLIEGVIDLDWFTFVALDDLQPPPKAECPTPPVIECPTTVTYPTSVMNTISTVVYNTTMPIVNVNVSSATQSDSFETGINSVETDIHSIETETDSSETGTNSTETETSNTEIESKNAAKTGFNSPFCLIFICVLIIKFSFINY